MFRITHFDIFFCHIFTAGGKIMDCTINLTAHLNSRVQITTDCQVSLYYSYYFLSYDEKCSKIHKTVSHILGFFSYIKSHTKNNEWKNS